MEHVVVPSKDLEHQEEGPGCGAAGSGVGVGHGRQPQRQCFHCLESHCSMFVFHRSGNDSAG